MLKYKINNRKVLAGIAELIGYPDKIIEITIAIDKLDKIGLESVNQELLEKGISRAAIDQLQPILHLQGTAAEKLEQLKNTLGQSAQGLQGVSELTELFALA